MSGQHGAGCTALQVAAACLCLYHKTLFGTVGFETQDPELPVLNIVTKTHRDDNLSRIICQCISLGGFHYSCVALEEVNMDQQQQPQQLQQQTKAKL